MAVGTGRRGPASHGLIEDAQGPLKGGSSGLRVLRLRRCERHVYIFKDGARSDAAKTGGRLDKVVAWEAGLFAAESVSEQERFGKLTGVHKEARAVHSPWTFNTHKFLIPRGRGT
jgi:hypothetical protein